MTDRVRIGTRGSPLALAQTQEVVDRLRRVDPSRHSEVVVVKTHGDEGYRSDLGTGLDGKRAFTKRIEEALLGGRIDIAVHSLKDLPTDFVDRLVLAAVPARADPRDVFVASDGRRLSQVSRGTRVGTSSLRRRAQLLARWPGLTVVELHGNVGTRLQRLHTGDLDAVVVAAAGLERLRIEGLHAEPLDPDVVTPAPGQGALAVQAREEDEEIRKVLSAIDDVSARTTTEAERALSARIGGGCNVPFGALASIEAGRMTLRSVVASTDGRRLARAIVNGASADWRDLVDEAARRLAADGAHEILLEASS